MEEAKMAWRTMVLQSSIPRGRRTAACFCEAMTAQSFGRKALFVRAPQLKPFAAIRLVDCGLPEQENQRFAGKFRRKKTIPTFNPSAEHRTGFARRERGHYLDAPLSNRRFPRSDFHTTEVA